MLIYKKVQLHTTFIHRHVLVTPVTVFSVSYDKNMISIQIIVQKCMVKPLNVTRVFSKNLLLVKMQVIPTTVYTCTYLTGCESSIRIH
jgi:hypothetical protein